jgi:uncharacterized HAD superfamily protein
MVALNQLLEDSNDIIARSPLRDVNPVMRYAKPYGNKLLIVDDTSSCRSVTFTNLQDRLAGATGIDITYACVYRESAESKVDLYFEEIPQPRMFGWNWFRHWNLRLSMLDMDGVLCVDWKSRPERNEDPEFVDHIKYAKPLYIPDVPVQAIVTSRLERYRSLTEDWLERNGVEYGSLIMHPAATPEERRARGDHADRKALMYRKGLEEQKTRLFVESSRNQATKIAELTRSPVLCVDSMEMF